MNKNYNSKYLKYKMKYLHEKENLIGGVRGKRIILFAISANPPTISHLNIVIQLASQYERVIVWTSTNPLKQNPQHSDYDPHYLEEELRIDMFKQCVEALCLENVIFAQEYADLYSGVSICKYIESNLTLARDEGQINTVPLKQFSVKPEAKDAGLSKETYELWICFGKDVVADTPNWTYNNLFLTLATGIVMIEREDGNDYSGSRYSIFTQYACNEVVLPNGTKYFTMPCIKGKEKVKVIVIENDKEKEVMLDATIENIKASINSECLKKNPNVVPPDIRPKIDGPLCIVEKKSLEHLGDTSSSRVRNYMMLWHLTEKPEDKAKIVKKLKQMVPEQVLQVMMTDYLYTIPNLDSKTTVDDLNKRIKILEKLGLPTNQQIIARIVDKEFFG